jgi:hypothetical protein
VIVVVTATTTAAAGLAPAPPLTLHETIPELQSIRPSWTELGSAIRANPSGRLADLTGKPRNRLQSVDKDASLFDAPRQVIS